MLVFHSHCQMGNQMFIYAAARGLSSARGITYCLSEIDKLQYFKLAPGERWLNPLKYFFFKLQNKLPGGKYLFHHLQDSRLDYSTEMQEEKHSRVWYYGYFQGEKYWYGNSKDFHDFFSIKSRYKKEFENARTQLLPQMTSYGTVHIRLRDYRTFGPDYLNGPDLTLPFAYYHKLLKENAGSVDKWVIMSDEPETVKNEFAYLGNKAVFSNFSPIVDFQLISHAEVCINSHSTFSWWASQLNKNPNKKIFVPEYFLGFKVQKEFPAHIIPASFIRVPVE